jgi:hypothetical protein
LGQAFLLAVYFAEGIVATKEINPSAAVGKGQ